MAPMDDVTPFLAGPEALPPAERLYAPAIYGIIGGAVVLVVVLIFFGIRQLLAPPPPAPPSPQQDKSAMTTQPVPFPATLPVETSFAGLDLRPKEKEPELPPIPKAEPVAQASPPVQGPVPPPPEEKKPVVEKKDPPKKDSSTQQAAPAVPKPPPKPPRWLFADKLALGKPVFESAPTSDLSQRQQAEDARAAKGDSLIQKAHVVRAADPTGMLYRGTPIHGILLKNVNSDIPGDLSFYVDRHVMDAHGQGRILIPQHSQGIVTQTGQVKFGDERIPGAFAQLRFPDGTLVTFKGQIADKSGASGLPGDVNNHIPQLLLKIVASTALTIGSRLPSGNTTGYQPTLPQQFADDASRGLNQAGQKIVQQQLDRPPTITAHAGDLLTIEVQENINFDADVIIVK